MVFPRKTALRREHNDGALKFRNLRRGRPACSCNIKRQICQRRKRDLIQPCAVLSYVALVNLVLCIRPPNHMAAFANNINDFLPPPRLAANGNTIETILAIPFVERSLRHTIYRKVCIVKDLIAVRFARRLPPERQPPGAVQLKLNRRLTALPPSFQPRGRGTVVACIHVAGPQAILWLCKIQIFGIHIDTDAIVIYDFKIFRIITEGTFINQPPKPYRKDDLMQIAILDKRTSSNVRHASRNRYARQIIASLEYIVRYALNGITIENIGNRDISRFLSSSSYNHTTVNDLVLPFRIKSSSIGLVLHHVTDEGCICQVMPPNLCRHICELTRTRRALHLCSIVHNHHRRIGVPPNPFGVPRQDDRFTERQ